jgi:hypothetical protein
MNCRYFDPALSLNISEKDFISNLGWLRGHFDGTLRLFSRNDSWLTLVPIRADLKGTRSQIYAPTGPPER